MATIIVIAVVLLLMGLAIHSLIKQKKSGGCHGSCSGCSGCGTHHNLEDAFQKETK